MIKNALSGAQLELLLDRLEADLEENESAEAIDLLGRLRASPLRADSLAAVDRLHDVHDNASLYAVLREDPELFANHLLLGRLAYASPANGAFLGKSALQLTISATF